MKKLQNVNVKMIAALVVALASTSELFAQAPPPPGVPLDFGISALVAACIGYGVVKMDKD